MTDKPMPGPFHFNWNEKAADDELVFWYSTTMSCKVLKAEPALIVAKDPEPTSKNLFVPLILSDANSIELDVMP